MLTTCEQHSTATQTQTHTAEISTQTYKPSTQEDTVTRDENSLREEFTAEYVINEQEESYQCIKILVKEGIFGQIEVFTQTEIPSINEKATMMDSPLCMCKVVEKNLCKLNNKQMFPSSCQTMRAAPTHRQTVSWLTVTHRQTDTHTWKSEHRPVWHIWHILRYRQTWLS